MEKQSLLEQLKQGISTQNIIDSTVELCSQNTTNPPGNEYLCTPVLQKWFSNVDFDSVQEYEKEKGRTNIIASIKGNKPGLKLAVVCHSDVVPVQGQKWNGDAFTPVVKDGKIYARGSADNKGPLASVLEAIRAFTKITKKNFAGEIIFVTVADEETGSVFGIKYLLEEKLINCDCVLVPDGMTFSKVFFGEMGIFWLKFESRGKAYHGSMPERGQNAIIPLTYLVQLLSEYKWEKMVGDKNFDHTVINIGTLNGGSAPNIVPDNASLDVMWRYPVGVHSEDINRVCSDFVTKLENKYKNANISVEQKTLSRPFIGNKNANIFRQYQNACEHVSSQKPVLKTIRGETIAKYINQLLDCDVCVNGPDDESLNFVHGPNENIAIDSLVTFSKIYAVTFFNLFCQN